MAPAALRLLVRESPNVNVPLVFTVNENVIVFPADVRVQLLINNQLPVPVTVTPEPSVNDDPKNKLVERSPLKLNVIAFVLEEQSMDDKPLIKDKGPVNVVALSITAVS